MRKLFIFLVAVVLSAGITTNLSAQKLFNFEYVTMGQGQSPVADGLMFSAAASHGDNAVLATFGTINAYAMYLQNDFVGIKGAMAGPSAGFFSGVPWVGPIAMYSPHPSIEFLGWVGLSSGDAATGRFSYSDFQLAFVQADVKVNITDNFYSGFSYLEFGGESYLPYVGGEIPLGNTMSLFGSATFPVDEWVVQDPQFFLGFRLGFN